MEINTINSKQQQLERGYFSVGTGNELIFILGSCRTVPYIGYFDKWNVVNNNRFTICFIDPYNFCYDLDNNRIDMEAKINSLETNDNILTMLGSCTIFLHEHYQNFGMFNTNKDASKNIYKYRMKPTIDICIPNFNDLFILFGDIVKFDTEIRKKAIQDYNVTGKLSEQTEREILDISQSNINKFYEVCRKSDLPEMELYFKVNHLEKRFFWNSNHVSKHFTLAVFKLINEKFLNLEMSNEYLSGIGEYDMFANNYTYLTEYDVKHGVEWNETVKDLREYL